MRDADAATEGATKASDARDQLRKERRDMTSNEACCPYRRMTSLIKLLKERYGMAQNSIISCVGYVALNFTLISTDQIRRIRSETAEDSL
jgi:hypothetical protein